MEIFVDRFGFVVSPTTNEDYFAYSPYLDEDQLFIECTLLTDEVEIVKAFSKTAEALKG